jgi:sulfite reductase (ferredoxin)
MLNAHGEQVEGFQIHLGGALGMAKGETAGFGRKLRGLKATAEELPEYVERVARNYLAGRSDGETFATWVMRAEEALLK